MPQDIRHDSTGDVLLTGGDISIGESTYQHQRDIALSRKGDIRTKPRVGVGIEDWLLDEGVTDGENNDLTTELRRQYRQDGMIVKKLDLKGDVDANYPNG